MGFDLVTSDRWQDRSEWFFQRDLASTYEQWYEGPYKHAEVWQKRVLGRLISADPRVKSLLEYGCGTSRFTRWWHEIGIEATGADISPFMIAEALERFDGDLALAHSQFMPYRDKTFDAVAFVTTFEYYVDPVEVVREAARVGRYGILFGMIHKITPKTIRRRVQQAFGKNPFYETARFYSLWSLKRIIAEALRDEPYTITWSCTGLPKWWPVQEWHVPVGDFLGLYVRRGVT
ncbi:MAG TPA: class I SAM-dependent methyltransferase [Gammaproteobacteria bacterium]